MRYRLATQGVVFSTRERGAKVREEIENAVRQLSDNEPLVIDFDGVELISFSFADEVVGGTLADVMAGNLGEHPVFISAANSEVLEPIQRSLERRGLVGALLQGRGSVRLLNAPPHLQQTLDSAIQRNEFRTSELASSLGISVSACNNRLKPLLAMRFLSRVKGIPRSGGREYVYQVARPLAKEEQEVA